MDKWEFSHWHEGSDEGKIPQGRQLHQHSFLIYILNSASIPQGLVTGRTSINTLNSSNLCTIASLMKTPPPSRLKPCLKAITFGNARPAANQSKERQGSLPPMASQHNPLPGPPCFFSIYSRSSASACQSIVSENTGKHSLGKKLGQMRQDQSSGGIGG